MCDSNQGSARSIGTFCPIVGFRDPDGLDTESVLSSATLLWPFLAYPCPKEPSFMINRPNAMYLSQEAQQARLHPKESRTPLYKRRASALTLAHPTNTTSFAAQSIDNHNRAQQCH